MIKSGEKIGIDIYICKICLNRDTFEFLPLIESYDCLIEFGDSLIDLGETLRKLIERVGDLRELNNR